LTSSQFNFNPDDLASIATHYIHTDHDQALSASVGASYLWRMTTFSVDTIIGTRVRKGGAIPNGDHVPAMFRLISGSRTISILGAPG
jgi:hypothetical protein